MTDYQPTASIKLLKRRAEILSSIRRFFDGRNFFEVETPILSNDIVVDRYLEPIPVNYSDVISNAGDSKRLWLQTSPEFGMKRLLASGAEATYEITKAFRAGEAGDRHNPEFTMLEWYRVGDDYQAGMDLLAEFTLEIFKVFQKEFEQVEQKTYRDVFLEYADLDPFQSDITGFKKHSKDTGIDLPASFDNEDIDFWRNLILTHTVEPNLGKANPVIVCDWPASQAALAKIRKDQHPVAERFELYVNGVELANGYHELLEADELRQRNVKVNNQRTSDGTPPLPVESRLLGAMKAGLPACSGVAMGVDRLVMVLLGAKSIRDVIAFPVDRA